MDSLAEGELQIASALSLGARPTIQPPRAVNAPVQTLVTRRHRFEASTIRLSVPADRAVDRSADNDQRIEHGMDRETQRQ